MNETPHPSWDDWRDRLRELRELSGMTQRALAHAARLSKSTMNALETGRMTPKRIHAVALDEGLSSLGVLSSFWDDVSGRGRRVPEWWAKPLESEKRAERILEYEPCIIPGLLQSTEYAKAMLSLGDNDSEQISKNVDMRTARLDSLQAETSFILTERALLSHPPDQQELVLGQLDHVLKLTSKRKIRLQVLPDESIPLDAHLGFRIVAINSQQSIVYSEHALGGVTKGDANSITRMTALFERLSSDSLPVKMSMEWIRRAQSQWNGGTNPATAAQGTTTASRLPDQHSA